MIGRRQQLATLLTALAAPRIAVAQPAHKRRLAIFVAATSDGISEEAPFWRPFFQQLRRLGHAQETNPAVTGWSGGGDSRRFEPLAREIIASQPDVVLAWGGRLAVALRAAGAKMPVVVTGSDLTQFKIFESYARPGGNMTGLSTGDTAALPGKRLELLHEFRPTATTAGYLQARARWKDFDEAMFRAATQRRGLQPVAMLLDVPLDAAAYRRAFGGIAGNGPDLLVVGETAENFVNRAVIVELAAQYRLPAVYYDTAFVTAGGLMSYGYDAPEVTRLVARLVARVLNGENPADMPVHVHDRLRLVLNLSAARALRIDFAPPILARADEVVE